MLPVLLPITLALGAWRGAVTLRYAFPAGHTAHYTVDQTVVVTRRNADAPPVEESREVTRGVLEWRVYSVDQKDGTVENRFISGSHTVRTPAGTTSELLKPSVRRTKMTPHGKLLATLHVDESGASSASPQP